MNVLPETVRSLALAAAVGLAPCTASPAGCTFLAAGIILNLLKEELPNERRSRFRALAAGIAGDAALLLAV